MCQKIKSTIKSFLDNNLELYKIVITKNPVFAITPLTRLQLIIMYLRLNKHDLKKCDIENKELIMDLIQNNNFILDELNISIDGKILKINELNEIANKLYEYQQKNKIKNLTIETTNKSTSHTKSTRIIEFKPKNNELNPQLYFSRGFILTKKNIGDYNKIRSHTKMVFNNILMHFINADSGKITFDEAKILYFIIEIFTLNYITRYIEIPYDLLNLPNKEIAPMVLTDSDEYVKKLKKEFEQCSQRIDILSQRKQVFEKKLPTHSIRLTPKIDEELSSSSLKQFEIGIELEELRKNPGIYNKQILNVINEALNNWSIKIINHKNRTRFEFLTFNNVLLENDVEIYLEGLTKLIHMEQLLSFLDKPELVLKNRSI